MILYISLLDCVSFQLEFKLPEDNGIVCLAHLFLQYFAESCA